MRRVHWGTAPATAWPTVSARRVGGALVVLIAAAIVSPPAVWSDNRTIDGTMNNLANPAWGSVDVQLLRQATPAYGDAISDPAGSGLPSARAISNS